jgi:hypothetical protein
VLGLIALALSCASPCVVAAQDACLDELLAGADVALRQETLVRPNEPTLGRFDESDCVGLLVVPKRPVTVGVRLFGRDGATWQEGTARPVAFVRGCGEPRWALWAAESVVVTLVVLRGPPTALPRASCLARQPGLAARPTPVGPEPPVVLVGPDADDGEPLGVDASSGAWELDVVLELEVHGEHRIDLASRAGCVRVDVRGPITGGRLTSGSFAAELWAMPYGARGWVCGAGATTLFVEGDGGLAVTVSRAPPVDLGISVGPEGEATWVDALGSARSRGALVQAYLRAGERLAGMLQPVEPEVDCRRWVAVAGDESLDARFELRIVAADGRVVGRARGGPGRAARVDACEEGARWELVQLGPAGRVVVGEAAW